MLKLAGYAFVFILIISFIEIGLHFMIRQLRKSFQWLITAQDKLPGFSTDMLDRFLDHSFDPELGWARKPNTHAQESSGTANETSKDYKKSAYIINYRGGRLNPGHEHLPALISTYGDSFVFSRQVNDNETWQWFLSRTTQSNVLNFGVGNYGIDQAFLRLKREYEQNRTSILILGVVPETIVRILSVWKHYSEYGNFFAFKPRFELKDDKLTLIRNVIDCKDKFLKIHEYLHHLQHYDYFYANKFRKDILYFPYLVSLSRSAHRNVPLIAALLKKQLGTVLGETETSNNRPWEMVLENNFEIVRDLYKSPDTINLFLKILDDFATFGKQHGFHPVFLFMPYLHDILYIKDNDCYYADFVSQAQDIIHTIDLTQPLMSSGIINSIYSSDFYGGHLNKKGNEFVSEIVGDELMEFMPSDM